MKPEDLNKTQIILLTLLTSFVTSIATGIVTVSLLAQAPPGVTQTINRVVERTVERVVPAETPSGQDTIVKETTVVVKEEDLIAKTIETGSQSIVRIRLKPGPGAEGAGSLIALGIIVSEDGLVATDASSVSQALGSYSITAPDGKIYDSTFASRDSVHGIQLLKMEGKDIGKFIPAKLGSTDGLRLGQTVIVIGGAVNPQVATGIVASLTNAELPGTGSTTTPATKIVTGIEATVVPNGPSGAPLLSLFGEIIGLNLNTGPELSRNNYLPVEFIRELITLETTPKPKTQN